MIVLTADEISLLHEKLLAATGGTPGLRDRGLLESAVFGVNAGFENVEQYPTVEEKAARLAYAYDKRHKSERRKCPELLRCNDSGR